MSADLITAARRFCARVERGEIRSRRSYAEFRAALDEIDGVIHTIADNGPGEPCPEFERAIEGEQ
jgi:hypothetical protein